VSLIAREAFVHMDAPIAVVAAPDSPIPYAPELEDAYLPSAASLKSALEDLLAY
jgi:pyruvate/2-oxoglutarate/acetoin dehydrogenase E1 component